MWSKTWIGDGGGANLGYADGTASQGGEDETVSEVTTALEAERRSRVAHIGSQVYGVMSRSHDEEEVKHVAQQKSREILAAESAPAQSGMKRAQQSLSESKQAFLVKQAETRRKTPDSGVVLPMAGCHPRAIRSKMERPAMVGDGRPWISAAEIADDTQMTELCDRQLRTDGSKSKGHCNQPSIHACTVAGGTRLRFARTERRREALSACRTRNAVVARRRARRCCSVGVSKQRFVWCFDCQKKKIGRPVRPGRAQSIPLHLLSHLAPVTASASGF